MPVLPYKGITPAIATTAFVAHDAVVIGKVDIGEDSSVWFGCVARGDVHSIHIGARTNIQDGSVIHVTTGGNGTWIGDDVTVGHMVLLHDCRVESGAFIGMGAKLLDGVVVENGAMVAAGALVTPGKRVPAGELWAGSPAKFMRKLTPQDLEGFKKSADHYVQLAHSYLVPE